MLLFLCFRFSLRSKLDPHAKTKKQKTSFVSRLYCYHCKRHFWTFFFHSEVVLLWFHSYCLHMKGSTEALSPTVTKGKLRVVFVFMLLLMFVVCALCFCLLSLLDVKTKLSMLMILSPVWIQKFLTCAWLALWVCCLDQCFTILDDWTGERKDILPRDLLHVFVEFRSKVNNT